MSDFDHDSASTQLTVTSEDRLQFKRLDLWLAHHCTELSRTTIKNLFTAEEITLAELSPYQGKLELKKMPPAGAIVEVCVPPPLDYEVAPEPIDLTILFEDEHLLIVVKPAGMVTHPAPGNTSGTLVNAILHHCPDIEGVGGVKRPGIVHRLDKGTSGVMVVAKNHRCHEKLVELFSKHDLTRRYEALTLSHPKQLTGTLRSTIGRDPKNRKKMSVHGRGKTAITHYKLIEKFPGVSHLELTLETGRTHQIRVHLAQLLNCPILMDETYGEPRRHLKHLSPELVELLKDYPHPLLHARHLSFVHPITKAQLGFDQPAPEIFEKTLNLLQESARSQHD
jgi:23S rRNA pseudouridine1911/1915/1917 synthase